MNTPKNVTETGSSMENTYVQCAARVTDINQCVHDYAACVHIFRRDCCDGQKKCIKNDAVQVGGDLPF